jgi:hypothetical protein
MSSLDLDLDSQMSSLESEWRQAYETSIAARAELRALGENSPANTSAFEQACQRLDRAEAMKARIMAKIERLEDNILGSH